MKIISDKAINLLLEVPLNSVSGFRGERVFPIVPWSIWDGMKSIWGIPQSEITFWMHPNNFSCSIRLPKCSVLVLRFLTLMDPQRLFCLIVKYAILFRPENLRFVLFSRMILDHLSIFTNLLEYNYKKLCSQFLY